MPGFCSIALAVALGCGNVARPVVEFTAEVPLRTRIETAPLDEVCATEYRRVPLAERLRFGEVRDERIAPAARHFYETFVADWVGWPSTDDWLRRAREQGLVGAGVDAYAAEGTRRRRADEGALSDLLIELGRVETPDRPEFRAYGTCLRAALIARLHQLPKESFFPLRPERLIHELEPEPVPAPRPE